METYKIVIVIGNENETKTIQGEIKVSANQSEKLYKAINDSEYYFYIKELIKLDF